MKNTSLRVSAFSQNTTGRDIVIGDLHGCRDVLFRLLENIRFDPACDRVFSSGDLIDRGPQSFETLSLINEPWFHAVSGNHEDHFEDLLEDLCTLPAVQQNADDHERLDALIHIRQNWLTMGNDWVESWLGSRPAWETVDTWRMRMHALPHAIQVECQFGVFNVVHADLFFAGISNNAMLRRLDMRNDPDCLETMLWGSANAKNALAKKDQRFAFPSWDAPLGPTFCGHNTVPFPLAHEQHIFLDTGCSKSAVDFNRPRLTGFIIQEDRFVQEASC